MNRICSRVSVAAAAALGTALVPLSASAYDLTTLGNLTQHEFRLLSEDLGGALSYKPITPTEALGVTGFDIGAALSGTQLKNAVLLSKAANGSTVRTTAPLLSLHADKGLPFNIDVGGSYTMVPSTNIKAFGGEVRWAFLPGTTLVPAVGIRLSGTKLTGVDQLDFSTYGADISVSKGFTIFTPYAGVGEVFVKSTPNGAAAATLASEKFNQAKFYAGVNINLGVNLAFEYDNTGSINTVSAKVGFRF